MGFNPTNEKEDEMKQKAFTLIELLIVIAIIAILATIIILSLSNSRKKANKAAAVASINEVLKAAQLCTVSGGTLVNINDGKDSEEPGYTAESKTPQLSGADVCSITSAAAAVWPTSVRYGFNGYTVLMYSRNIKRGVTYTQFIDAPAGYPITCRQVPERLPDGVVQNCY